MHKVYIYVYIYNTRIVVIADDDTGGTQNAPMRRSTYSQRVTYFLNAEWAILIFLPYKFLSKARIAYNPEISSAVAVWPHENM